MGIIRTDASDAIMPANGIVRYASMEYLTGKLNIPENVARELMDGMKSMDKRDRKRVMGIIRKKVTRGEEVTSAILDEFTSREGDPQMEWALKLTKKVPYAKWLVAMREGDRMGRDNGEEWTDDGLGALLARFDARARTPDFPEELKDIMKYKSPDDLEVAIEPYMTRDERSKAQRDADFAAGSKNLGTFGKCDLYRMDTKEAISAACHGTEYCVRDLRAFDYENYDIMPYWGFFTDGKIKLLMHVPTGQLKATDDSPASGYDISICGEALTHMFKKGHVAAGDVEYGGYGEGGDSDFLTMDVVEEALDMRGRASDAGLVAKNIIDETEDGQKLFRHASVRVQADVARRLLDAGKSAEDLAALMWPNMDVAATAGAGFLSADELASIIVAGGLRHYQTDGKTHRLNMMMNSLDGMEDLKRDVSAKMLELMPKEFFVHSYLGNMEWLMDVIPYDRYPYLDAFEAQMEKWPLFMVTLGKREDGWGDAARRRGSERPGEVIKSVRNVTFGEGGAESTDEVLSRISAEYGTDWEAACRDAILAIERFPNSLMDKLMSMEATKVATDNARRAIAADFESVDPKNAMAVAHTIGMGPSEIPVHVLSDTSGRDILAMARMGGEWKELVRAAMEDMKVAQRVVMHNHYRGLVKVPEELADIPNCQLAVAKINAVAYARGGEWNEEAIRWCREMDWDIPVAGMLKNTLSGGKRDLSEFVARMTGMAAAMGQFGTPEEKEATRIALSEVLGKLLSQRLPIPNETVKKILGPVGGTSETMADMSRKNDEMEAALSAVNMSTVRRDPAGLATAIADAISRFGDDFLAVLPDDRSSYLNVLKSDPVLMAALDHETADAVAKVTGVPVSSEVRAPTVAFDMSTTLTVPDNGRKDSERGQ